VKQKEPDKDILERMAAGVLCREGFLGTDARPLAEILNADLETVRRLGVSHEQLAGRLAEILLSATAAMGNPVDVARGLQGLYHEAMGRIPCPCGDGRCFPKGEVELTDLASGRTLRLSPLSVHLIGEHGFYQGRGSRYRIEPDVLCEILKLGRPRPTGK
jgi:hypothetical protein